MAINRAPFNALVDDNGTGLTGSIWNKAAIQGVILDPADVAYGPAPIYGNWTPVDASGAGLVLNIQAAMYAKLGRVMNVWVRIVMPSTANGGQCTIGGLPFPATTASALYTTYGPPLVYHIGAAQASLLLFDGATAAAKTNAQMSGATILAAGIYLTDS